MKSFYSLLIFSFFSYFNFCVGQNFSSVKALIQRQFPTLERKVVFNNLPSTRNDSAYYYSKKDKLYIYANATNAASYALYDYIKIYCHSSLSHTGNNIKIPKILPETASKINIHAVFPLRYALNYCTYNYTMAFWKWDKWENELDWMALNGVNLMLAPNGTEAIWQKTLTAIGMSDEDIRKFIPGPAYNAWWLMGNLEGWGGPVSDPMIEHWKVLQQKILHRMKDLNIEPVMQGFTGLVPSTLVKYFPQAKIVDQGEWWGFKRPMFLDPKDTLFYKIANLYYANMKQLYGNDIHYLGGDLFHEGGNTKNIDLTISSKLIQQNMQSQFPNCTWVLQGWQSNPAQKILDGLTPKNTLIIDLKGDDSQTWLDRNQYNNFPWIWATITNFGGKTTSSGTLMRVYTETNKAERIFKNKLQLKGTGIIPEGIDNNPIVYQWALDRAWQNHVPDIQKNLDEFIYARYGTINENLRLGWQYLLQTIYNGVNPEMTGGQGGYESIFCARPGMDIQTTSCCGPVNLWYDKDILTQAALCFYKAADSLQNISTFHFDLTDIWRQVINLKARFVYSNIMKAIKKKDENLFQINTSKFTELLKLQDRWLGTDSLFRVGRWLEEAKNMLPDEQDKQLCEWNARAQITYWGPENNPDCALHDYANKEWQGLLKDLYLDRWNAFFEYLQKTLKDTQVNAPVYFNMEKKWAHQQNYYSPTPFGNRTTILNEMMEKASKN